CWPRLRMNLSPILRSKPTGRRCRLH
ncbi:MAG: hypothetical protein AVDCRST_MAG26-2177, partial [uncultured Chloroflexia bacterium]